MAVLAIGAVGAMVGASAWGVGIGLTAAMGWNIGLTVGGMLFGPKGQNIYQQGPRLGDLKVQSSTYGNPIPIVYGSMRIAGNMIWARDIVETAHTTTQSGGGKGGGGGGSVTQTNYTYSQSFAVALCEGEIAGVRKIWANGKLIYNLSDTADIATIVASNKSAAGIRIYTGSETQTADSLIQAHVGAADTPAYRGIAYVVFENLQLADHGNRTPNVEFEVVRLGSSSQIATVDYSPFNARSVLTHKDRAYYIGNGVCVLNRTTGAYIKTIAIGVTDNKSAAIHNDYLYVTSFGGNALVVIDLNADAVVTTVALGNKAYGIAIAEIEGVAYAFVAMRQIHTVHKIRLSDYSIVASHSTSTYPESIKYDGQSLLLIGCYYGVINRLNLLTGITTNFISTGYAGNTTAIYNQDKSKLYVSSASMTVVRVYDAGTLSLVDTLTSTASGVMDLRFGSSGKLYVSCANSSGFIDVDSDQYTPLSAGISYGCDVSTDEYFFYVSHSTNGNATIVRLLYYLTATIASLSSIASDICTRAGLTAGQIDVTALTDEVSGYVVQRSTARAQLEQLMQAFYFDAVESDGKIKFVKRGGSSAVSIPEDDLAAHEYGSAPPDTLITTRRQEMELPVECNVQYMDTGSAYLIGTQRTQRLTTESENKISVNLAIAMTATKAKQIADVLMYDSWAGRTTFAQAHGWKYSYLEPTDIITVTKDGRSYVMRIVDEDASGGIYARQAVLEDISVYSQTGAAAELPAAVETVAGVPLTNLLLLDIPILRDQDDGVGFYAAACGYGDGWYGAQSFKSNDGGATWNSFGNGLLNDAAIGTASTVLGDFTQNIFDESNSVTVVMINGELASDTELNVLNGANVALLGDEIIQFRDATLVSAGTYTLTGLLRGRQGTEWARSTHATGDRFVLLSSSTTYLFSGAVAEYDLERKYRGVSFGGFLDDASTINFTNTAVAQIPYAPVHLGGGRNAAGDLTLKWVRRTRMSGGWNNYSDVPLGEASEAYVVEIYASGAYATIKRTITGLTSATTPYTAADQTTDFGAPQATVYWKVYQVSATVGNGYEARGVT